MENRIIKDVPLFSIDLSRILSVNHRQIGMQLTEDDHIVTLIKNGTELAHWNAHMVTVKQIHEECDRYMGGDAVEALQRIGGVEFGGAACR